MDHKSLFKINSADPSLRLFTSDRHSSFLTFSDLRDNFDGFYFRGLCLFNSLIPRRGGSELPMTKKSFSPGQLTVEFTGGINIRFSLFDNGAGLCADIDRRLFDPKTGSAELSIMIKPPFELLEKNIKNLILEYKDGSAGRKAKVFCVTRCHNDLEISLVERTPQGLNIRLFSDKKIVKDPTLVFFASQNYETIGTGISPLINSVHELIKERDLLINSRVGRLNIETNDPELSRSLVRANLSASDFVTKQVGMTGIFAGFPWFLQNWGRDAFISLPGITLVNGNFDIAKDILMSFAKRQNTSSNSKDFGKIPNFTDLDGVSAYNSADSTPLFIREAYEYYQYTGDSEFLADILPCIKKAVEVHYLKNSDKTGFMPQEDGDDWMDAKKDGKYSYSPRSVYAAEIQALWYAALFCASKLALIAADSSKQNSRELAEFSKLCYDTSDTVKISFKKYFLSDSPPFIFDHLDKDLKPSEDIRPNALLAVHFSDITGIPKLIDDEHLRKTLYHLKDHLFFRRGVSSLSYRDDRFHPVHISQNYHKDASYHNGMIWPWLSGSLVHAACRTLLQNEAFVHSKTLIERMNSSGVWGHLSELIDPYIPEGGSGNSGAYAQAWSIAEFNRCFFQDYLGFRPDMAAGIIRVRPALPRDIANIKTNVFFRNNESVGIELRLHPKTGLIAYAEIKAVSVNAPVSVELAVETGRSDSEQTKLVINAAFNSNSDSLTLLLEPLPEGRMKVRELRAGKLCGITALHGETRRSWKSLGDGFFARDLAEKDYLEFKTVKENNYLEKSLKK